MATKEFSKHFDRCIEIVNELILKNVDTTKDPRSIHASYLNFLDWLIRTKEAVNNNPSENEENENAVKFFKFFNQLDIRRRTNILEVFPEITKFYNAGSNGIQPVVIPIRELK
jgi:hypothetical protein